jgi:hypothetical protein
MLLARASQWQRTSPRLARKRPYAAATSSLERATLRQQCYRNAGSHHSRSLIVRNRQPRRRTLLVSFRAKRWKSGRIPLLRGN